MTEVGHLLKHTPIASILGAPQKVLIIRSDQTLAQGLELLKNRGCLSAPVRDFAAGRFIGMFTVMDVVTYLLQVLAESDGRKHKPYAVFLKESAPKFFATQISELVGRFHKEAFPYIPLGSTSMSLDVLFDRVFSKGIHRVCVADADDSISHILSQSAGVAWAASHLSELRPVASRTAADLGWLKPVVTVAAGSTVLAALAALQEFRVHGVALTDLDGRVVGSFSASDLKGLTADTFPMLALPIGDCVTHLRASVGLPPVVPITLPTSATFADAVQKLATCHVHRVFVVDDAGRPAGVVTLTDVIHALVASAHGTAGSS